MKIGKYKILAVALLGYWVFLIGFALVDSRGVLGSDIGLVASLKTSSLARVMFMDIGGLSTLAALWIIFHGKSAFKYLIAGLTLLIGSFAALPYVAFLLWRRDA